MRQVLWFAGGHFPLPEDRRQFPEATLDWAREHGIQTNWIDEINWLTGGNRSGPAPRSGFHRAASGIEPGTIRFI